MEMLIRVGTVDGVSVRLHWSVVAGCALLAVASRPPIVVPLSAVAGYFAAVLLHEWGHAYLARRCRCRVYGIELYPLAGVTHFSQPYSHRDHCLIAWGGIAAQAVVAAPLLGLVNLAGYTRFEPVNVFIATFAWTCVAMILINLLPVPPLDGALAWSRLPPLPRPPRWLRFRRHKKPRGWNALAGREATRR